ncbi:uncharacterized protein [Cardiocondyla obscurior]|uniref:uncharacterized protein n=1 Tax=Cardiocondyla obscurior TaxID=286306 RepID=UPI003965832D
MEIERLLLKKTIRQVDPSTDQFLSPFFLVDKPSGGKRFILNLKELNRYLSPPHFKLENWRTVVRLMLPDDFLLLGSSFRECQNNVNASLNLLLSLGFRINFEKSQLQPASSCKFLGFIFNSNEQSISIPAQRREGLIRLVSDMARKSQTSIRNFTSMIGSLISVCPAVQYGLLYTKTFERQKFLALGDANQNFSSRNLRDCNILLRIDNITALAYINKFGSVQYPYLSDISRQIWQWCEERNIFIFASYIASVENIIADAESRVTDPDTEWSLSHSAFQQINKNFGPFDVDIFASLLNAKCDVYISWFPDPGSFSVDAFTLSWSNEPSSVVGIPFPGDRDCIREAFRFRLIPPEAIPIMLASISEATIRQYARPLRLWWIFYQQHQVPLFSPSPSQVLRFLAIEAKSISSYSTLNSMRSAVSLISVNEIGQFPAIKRFCRGFASIKPPQPRYDFIWDPAPVIDKLRLIYPYEDLPLNAIARKLVLLLALATGQRVQTIASLRLSQTSIDQKLIIRIPDQIKTSAPGRKQPSFVFSRFEEQEELCIIRLLEHYIERTKELRISGCDALFISCYKPFRPVTSQTVSRWIRQALNHCGVDTSKFTAHSTRHASTSYAAKKGVALDLIKKAAG